MSDAERRQFPRFAVNLQVTLQSGARHELSSENISLGGLFLATAEEDLCQQGDEVSVELTLPGAEGQPGEPVAIPSVVAHVVPPLGFGVRFVLDDELEAKLRAYIERIAAVQSELA